MAFECKRTRAMSLLTTIYLCILLVRVANGQCQGTSCPCVPPEPAEPEDGENRCCLYISENLPLGSLIGNANDLEIISIADPRPESYRLDSSLELPGKLFNVNTTTGAITTAALIDRENISSIQDDCITFQIVANAGGTSVLSALALFGVVIMDENDNRPQFNSDLRVLNITVRENQGPNTLNCQDTILNILEATDLDDGMNGAVTYKVAEGSGSDLFAVSNPQQPCVRNLIAMDRENPNDISYSFVLVAMDGGSPPMTSNLTVIFTLLDVNDNAPVFLNNITEIGVREDTAVGTVIRQFQASDLDLETQPLRYSLGDTPTPFQINSETGKVNLTDNLNAESPFTTFSIVVKATDSDSTHTTELEVTINVIDVNEHISIPDQTLPTEIEEGTLIMPFSFNFIDNDKTEANRMNTLRLGSGGEYFDVAFGNRIIRQFAKIDRENVNVTDGIVQLAIIIEELGDPPLETQYFHNFTILDINDNEPYLTRKLFNFSETPSDVQDTGRNTIDLKEFVRDNDAGENGTVVTYTLVVARSANGDDLIEEFLVANALEEPNILNGNLLLPGQLDREVLGEVITVTMNFTDGGSPPMSRVDSFKINIMDINDNSPIFVQGEYTFTPTENRNPNSPIGSVMATDADDPNTVNGTVEYYLNETQGDFRYFTVDQSEGIVRSNYTFDREEKDSYIIYIDARDAGDPPRSASAPVMVTILIQDLNDEAPIFTEERYTFQVDSGANVGDFVNKVEAVDRDLNSTENQIIYKLLYPTPYFTIGNTSGEIMLARVVSINESPYNLTVVAYNPGSEHLRGNATVSIQVTTSALDIPIIGAISSGVALSLIVAITIVCCCICCLCYKSRTTGKLEVDGIGSHLNNQKPILKTSFPATNGQQRSVKFSTTVEETHYDPSGLEHSVIRKESNLGSGDESPQTSLRTMQPNGAVNMNNHDHEEILEYDMSPSLVLNGDIPHHRPQYPRHGRMPSPIMLHEELNASEFSQSTSSVMDDRNTYNSEGEEAESTYSDAPSNLNIPIPRFGRQTIQVEDHRRPSDLPSHTTLELHAHLPLMQHMHGQHSSPGHLAELRAHNLAALNAQYTSASHPHPVGVPPAEDMRDLSLGSLQRNIGHHHYHGSITSSHDSTPPTRHIQRQLPLPGMHQPPPVSMSHSIVTPPSNGHTNTRNYPLPLVMPEAFPTRVAPTDVHRFDSFIPSFGDYGETSTYASTELNEALEFKYEAEPDFCSLTATDYDENDTEL